MNYLVILNSHTNSSESFQLLSHKLRTVQSTLRSSITPFSCFTIILKLLTSIEEYIQVCIPIVQIVQNQAIRLFKFGAISSLGLIPKTILVPLQPGAILCWSDNYHIYIKFYNSINYLTPLYLILDIHINIQFNMYLYSHE